MQAKAQPSYLHRIITNDELLFIREPIACAAFGLAPRHLWRNDLTIGWNAAARLANIRLIAYQQRFLILPWVERSHLASHLLSRLSHAVNGDWQKVCCPPLTFIEMIVDPARISGACYRTAKRGKMGVALGNEDQRGVVNRSLKKVMGMPLARDFRQPLASE